MPFAESRVQKRRDAAITYIQQANMETALRLGFHESQRFSIGRPRSGVLIVLTLCEPFYGRASVNRLPIDVWDECIAPAKGHSSAIRGPTQISSETLGSQPRGRTTIQIEDPSASFHS